MHFSSGGYASSSGREGGRGVGGHHGSAGSGAADSWNEDSHYRWPSPSLPPTLKKGTTLQRNNNNYDHHEMMQASRYYGTSGKGQSRVKGTLDHGRIHERVAIPTSSSSGRTTGTAGTGDGFSSSDNGAGGAVNARSSGGREYYNVLNNSRDEKYSRGRRIKQSSARNPADTSSSYEFNSQSEEILDEFGDVVVVRSKPSKSSATANHHQPSPGKRGHRSSSDDDDGWTTEF